MPSWASTHYLEPGKTSNTPYFPGFPFFPYILPLLPKTHVYTTAALNRKQSDNNSYSWSIPSVYDTDNSYNSPYYS